MGRFKEPDLPAGTIKFFDHALPTLPAGEYQVRVEQDFDASKITLLQPVEPKKTFTFKRTFHVEGPRFSLGPSDVHSVYPPPNSQGQFENTIPHIVFRKRSLPWERVLASPAPRSCPWFALLVLQPGEVGDSDLKIQSIDQIVTAPAQSDGVLRPRMSLSALERSDLAAAVQKNVKVQGRTIDVAAGLFADIAPRLEEIPLLAHVRQVNTGDKELLGLDEDGWFSVMMANRVPAAGLNSVHLVSLESWEDLISGGAAPGGTQKLRLVSLVNWSFTSLARRGSFGDIMSRVSKGPLKIAVPAAVADAQSNESEDGRVAKHVAGALDRGYVPLAYDMRNGEHTAAWYRGPLLPVVLERKDRDPFPTVEAGLIYDPDTGMFDVSYAIAWQIGRLLALSDAGFSAALSEWRQAGHRVLDSMLEKAEAAQRFEEKGLWVRIGDINAEPDQVKKRDLAIQLLQDLLDPNVFSKKLSTLVVNQFEAQRVAAGIPDGAEVLVKSAPDSKERLAGGSVAKVNAGDIEERGSAAAEKIRDRILNPSAVGAGV